MRKIKVRLDYLLITSFVLMLLSLFAFQFNPVESITVNATGPDNATQFTMTFDTPLNNSINYNASDCFDSGDAVVSNGSFVNITINDTFVACKFMWDMNGTWYDLVNGTPENTTWHNASSYLISDFEVNTTGDFHNFTYWCYNGTVAAPINSTFTNTSIHRFKFYSSTSYTFMDETVWVNNSYYKVLPNINLTVSHSVKACYLSINGSAGIEMTNTSVRNITNPDSSVIQYFTNSSTLKTEISDTKLGAWHNITFYCEDAYDNVTWANSTNTPYIVFALDTTPPLFRGTPVWNLTNYTSGGNYIQMWFNISENNSAVCWAGLHYQDGNVINITTNVTYNTTVEIGERDNCTINITPSDITKDGYVEIVGYAMDAVGNWNSTNATNQSYIVYRLKEGWNLITNSENETLEGIAADLDNVTYVSVFDNQFKEFNTWTTGGSSNSKISANFSSNFSAGAAYIYVNEDVVSMRRYYNQTGDWHNVSITHNSTSNATPWNVVGIPNYIEDLNATMMKNACVNLTTWHTDEQHCGNITWVSWWDIQNGEFCSFYRSRLATGCNYRSNEINLTRGDALWIATQDGANFTIQRQIW